MFLRAVFSTEHLQCACRIVCGMFLPTLIFDPNWPFCKVYSPLQDGRFSKSSLFSNIWCSSKRFFRTKEIKCASEIVSRSFLAILNFWLRNWPFHKVYSLCKMADFQNRLISRIIGVFLQRIFAQNISNVLVDSFLACFWPIFNFWPKLTILQSL